jgi:hypothetical protein
MTLCCIGSELFAYRSRFIPNSEEIPEHLKEGVSPRINFDDFGNSLLGIPKFSLKDNKRVY